jgi:hypothetical protein
MTAAASGSGRRLGLVACGELWEQRCLLDSEGAEDRLLVGGQLGSLAAVVFPRFEGHLSAFGESVES